MRGIQLNTYTIAGFSAGTVGFAPTACPPPTHALCCPEICSRTDLEGTWVERGGGMYWCAMRNPFTDLMFALVLH